jgi:two-component system response regulator YesN
MPKPTLADLAETKILFDILDTFNFATDLTAIIVDLRGNPITREDDPLQACDFCRIIRENPEARKRCSEAYARAGKLAATICEPYIFRCPAGLIEWAAPILFEKQHLGSIICGRVLMWEPEDFFWVELTLMNKELGLDMVRLIAAAQKLPIISGKKVQAAADLLFAMANYIVESNFRVRDQQKRLEKQDLLLEEEMQTRKMLELALNPAAFGASNPAYSIKKEAQLLAKIRLVDKQQSLLVLKDILDELRQQYSDNLELLKARAIELLVMTCRATIEIGAAAENVLELNFRYTNELSKLNSPGEILAWIPLIVEQYLDLAARRQSKHFRVAKEITSYIRENHHRNLTLEAVAQAVYLSPYYVSRIFKEEKGCTVLEYLTKVRMEEAKKLLADPQKNVREVAKRVGYNNPSYFTKVFRATEGLTPSQFRSRYVV